MSDGRDSVVMVCANVWLKDGAEIRSSHASDFGNFVSIGSAEQPDAATLYVWSADAADELAEALKGVAAGIRAAQEGGGS